MELVQDGSEVGGHRCLLKHLCGLFSSQGQSSRCDCYRATVLVYHDGSRIAFRKVVFECRSQSCYHRRGRRVPEKLDGLSIIGWLLRFGPIAVQVKKQVRYRKYVRVR